MRQKRSEASSLMGQYLLKGYCMLNKYCADCQTILLRDKNNQEICVNCHVIEDKPLKQEEKKQKLTTETNLSDSKNVDTTRNELYQHAEKKSEESVELSKTIQNPARDEGHNGLSTSTLQSSVKHASNTPMPHQQSAIQFTIESLHQQLQWASEMLPQLSSIDGRIQMCNLIKITSEALREVRSLADPS
ncbi:uncharacterized protein TRIADDRAFT_57151 [Trichoplax adhaerens]|uniref:Sjoegren syndrome/scleroderma autoantigen 1 n=1 Tax=Trichoplax adhaerens TaxID=10228 RepID=B3S0S1_TRIAD|nr:hypothetical protein TRIADDRAFT_57151 [Trichoplax adhaerens]EDV24058.1 hypothetical protein TRIADDRAFT_57151 [Trichoplax adhaerens]|eukprot:XP_002113584.1 hypothetical protein TRIADDRAFT_57151 [Trichoplax adhaerens]